MARPLTKNTKAGVPYARDEAVDAQIDQVIGVDLARLKQRLRVTNQASADHLRPECLVHLAREGIREDNQPLTNAVLTALLARCEAVLRIKIADRLPNAVDLRESVLGEFSEMFAMDGAGDNPNQLDFFECKFNLAFRALYVDILRPDTPRLQHVVSATQEEDESGDVDEEALARVCESLRAPSEAEASVHMKQLLKAIDDLPVNERDAVVLVSVMGFKEESQNPNEKTAATICKCTGRTIRNRLTRAAEKLKPQFKERL